MHVVLLGSPGAGKGTQGRLLAKQAGVPHLSTGQMLRSMVPQSAEEKRIQDHILAGNFAPDEMMLQWIGQRLLQPDCCDGFVLDGFPRTRRQAEGFDQQQADSGCEIPQAIHLMIGRDIALQRLGRRRQTEARPDDHQDVIQRRFKLDQENLMPLLDHYRRRQRLIEVDGQGVPEEIAATIVMKLR